MLKLAIRPDARSRGDPDAFEAVAAPFGAGRLRGAVVAGDEDRIAVSPDFMNGHDIGVMQLSSSASLSKVLLDTRLIELISAGNLHRRKTNQLRVLRLPHNAEAANAELLQEFKTAYSARGCATTLSRTIYRRR